MYLYYELKSELLKVKGETTFNPEGENSISPAGGSCESAQELVGVRVWARIAAAEVSHVEGTAARHPRHFAEGDSPMALGQTISHQIHCLTFRY